MIDIQANVDKNAVREFLVACDRYRTEVGNTQAVAIRRGTIALIKSVRARTRKAPKLVDRKEVTISKQDPQYITTNDGKLLRRVNVVRWRKGKHVVKEHWLPVSFKYRRRMGMRNGNYQGIVSKVEDKSLIVKRARLWYGKIPMFGLAYQSWGWFMKSLFNRNETVVNNRASIKPSMVDGFLRDRMYGKGRVVDILIHNKIDYIRDALPNGALEEAMAAATNSINTQIDQGLAKARNGLK